MCGGLKVHSVKVKDIVVPARHRCCNPIKVKMLADSIGSPTGLLQPIAVTDDYKLIFGRHRLEAYKSLKRIDIPSYVLSLNDMDAELAMIDENLCRNELTPLEQAENINRRKAIYEAKHPETTQEATRALNLKQHRSDNMSLRENTAFSKETAAAIGKSTRTVERLDAIGKGIDEAAKTQIHGTPLANNKKQLEELTHFGPEEQVEIVKTINSGEAKKVGEAAKKAKVKPKEHKAHVITDSERARHQVKIWYETLGRWLGQSVSIDDIRNQYPGKKADGVVKLTTALYEALKAWQKEIK